MPVILRGEPGAELVRAALDDDGAVLRAVTWAGATFVAQRLGVEVGDVLRLVEIRPFTLSLARLWHMCYFRRMDDQVGLRELRQNASAVVRRIEAGESIVVTVNGRPAARLVPVAGRRWRRWDEVADVLSGQCAPGLLDDLAKLDGSVTDPFDVRS